MGRFAFRFFSAIVSTAVLAGSSFGSPLNNRLLALIPPGSDVVVAFENQPHAHGQLLLATHADRLDLQDWQAISGVDSKRVFDQIVEAAAAPFGGNLSEHVVLVAGHFDKEVIFKSVEMGGAERSTFDGETIMVIKPFAREQGDMLDTRWLAILDNRIGIFGTQWMVERALKRYTSHADIDMPLMERLSQLRSDVTSWSVLVAPPDASRAYQVSQASSPWTRFMEDAAVLMVGVRFGSKVRVDFLLHATVDHGMEFFEQKAATFAEVFAMDDSDLRPGHSRQRKLGNVTVQSDHVQASIQLSARQFDEWADQTTRNRAIASLQHSTSRGE
jgi:hypothetical protein